MLDGYVNNYAVRPSHTIRKLIKIENPIPFSTIVADAIPNAEQWQSTKKRKKN